MLSCFFYRRRLERAAACGLPRDRSLAAHLSRCPRCQTARAELDAVFRAVRHDAARVNEPGVSWAALRDATVARALAESTPARRWQFLVLAATTAATLSFALVRLLGTRDPRPLAPAEMQFLERMELSQASQETAAYLSESRDLLLGVLSPAGCEPGGDVSVEKKRSVELLFRARLLDSSLGRLELLRARPVSDDLALVLSEIARLPDCAPPERLREISTLVRRHHLLVRLDVLEGEL